MGIFHNSNNSSTQLHVELKSSQCSSSDCTKEKLSPAAFNSSPKSVLRNSHSKFAKNKNEGFGSQRKRDVKDIDDEIKSIENQIKRLSKRIEALRLENVERIALEKCRGGRIVASKFMEPKTKQNAVVSTKKVVETLKSKDVNSRQGASFQPAKIVSRVAPPLPPRKLLFKEGEKSVSESNKKWGLKEGRVVASRYKNYSEGNKRSLPESNNGSEVVRVRKRWEITSPSEVVNAIRMIQHGGNDNDNNNSYRC